MKFNFYRPMEIVFDFVLYIKCTKTKTKSNEFRIYSLR